MSASDIPVDHDSRSVDEIIREDFGFLAWAIDHPELGPLLRRAVDEGWSESTLRGSLHATGWWTTTSATARDWQATVAEDPAEAARRIEQRAATVSDRAATLGLQLSASKVRQIAESAERFGWSDTELADALGAEMQWRPEGDYQGLLGSAIDEVVQRAQTFLVPLGPDTTFQLARRMLTGEMDEAGLEAEVAKLARARFSHLQPQIDRGLTPAQLFSPYVSEAARLLEVNPFEVDLLNDPRVSRVLDPVTGGGEPRMMSLSEFGRMVRESEGWETTGQARQQASALGGALARTFGKVS